MPVFDKKFVVISTHAPRTGSDGIARGTGTDVATFQPTLPARGATQPHGANAPKFGISTHAPRTGSDPELYALLSLSRHFNPSSAFGE